jgi:hypothetical protein
VRDQTIKELEETREEIRVNEQMLGQALMALSSSNGIRGRGVEEAEEARVEEEGLGIKE